MSDRNVRELTVDELKQELAFGSVREFLARAELERRAGGVQQSLLPVGHRALYKAAR